MAFMAVFGTVPGWGWVLFGANMFWVVAYDTEYAMVDRDDDIRLGLRTSAVTFGRYDVVAVAGCYAAYFGGLAWVAARLHLGLWFWAGFAAAVALAVYHLWLIRTRERDRCFRAFLSNHWLGLAVFAGVALDFALRQDAWPRLR
jgi:4-hydroxybenzoate polyprenyltransferase